MKRSSIISKLTLSTIIGLFLMVSIITVFVFIQSKESILKNKFAKLNAVKTAKHEEIKSYFKSLENLLVSVAALED